MVHDKDDRRNDGTGAVYIPASRKVAATMLA